MPVAELPGLVTRYVTVAPLRQWKDAGVTGGCSIGYVANAWPSRWLIMSSTSAARTLSEPVEMI